MSETYPRKTLCETLFAGHTPSSVGFDCKGSEIFWIEQENSEVFVIFGLVDGTLHKLKVVGLLEI